MSDGRGGAPRTRMSSDPSHDACLRNSNVISFLKGRALRVLVKIAKYFATFHLIECVLTRAQTKAFPLMMGRAPSSNFGIANGNFSKGTDYFTHKNTRVMELQLQSNWNWPRARDFKCILDRPGSAVASQNNSLSQVFKSGIPYPALLPQKWLAEE